MKPCETCKRQEDGMPGSFERKCDECNQNPWHYDNYEEKEEKNECEK